MPYSRFSTNGLPAFLSRGYRNRANRGNSTAINAVNRSAARSIAGAYRAYRARRLVGRTIRGARVVRARRRNILRRGYM